VKLVRILPVILYGYETWSLILREEHRLKVYEENIWTEEGRSDWRKLHKEEPHHLYSSPIKIRMINSRRLRWAGHITRMERR
jgi:hypothetical protein